ncbi:hypothetical protein LAV_00207 [Sphingobium phage Lacusarx]|uniref:Uncharacterized protein n=1 Tax=Sphingobium phage Lacusarx TaxID=1980139 RepID=A0A1W6DXT6_9CAUD|nr:hypothetical protein FDH44_gp096 [Sphingobium phage Lacusarx]ARK07582.1 hypothetical protein LAV_00207 [Sphingobium phage Lacusarx]
MTIWTKELAEATRNLTLTRLWNEGGAVHETRVSLMQGVKDRAREIVAGNLPIGAELSPMQNDFINALRSRLGDFDLARHPVVAAWSAAYKEA